MNRYQFSNACFEDFLNNMSVCPIFKSHNPPCSPPSFAEEFYRQFLKCKHRFFSCPNPPSESQISSDSNCNCKLCGLRHFSLKFPAHSSGQVTFQYQGFFLARVYCPVYHRSLFRQIALEIFSISTVTKQIEEVFYSTTKYSKYPELLKISFTVRGVGSNVPEIRILLLQSATMLPQFSQSHHLRPCKWGPHFLLYRTKFVQSVTFEIGDTHPDSFLSHFLCHKLSGQPFSCQFSFV